MPCPLQIQSTSVATDSLLRKQAEAPWVGGYFRMVRERLNPTFGLELYAQARLVLSLCPQGTGTSQGRSWLQRSLECDSVQLAVPCAWVGGVHSRPHKGVSVAKEIHL